MHTSISNVVFSSMGQYGLEEVKARKPIKK